MNDADLRSTGEFAWRVFRPHGSLSYRWDGVLIEMEAHGPFNAEFLAALTAVQRPLLESLRAQAQRRADLVRFHGSCMASNGVMEVFAERLRELRSADLAPSAVCYVIDSEVEGARFMPPRFAACHAQAGIPFSVQGDLDNARAWALQHLMIDSGRRR